MANEPSKTQGTSPDPQRIPLAKIHDLPGVVIPKTPDKSYGGLVSSIQAVGIKEAVILRQREDGEYQLVDGYRRRRASELAKLTDVPALVYDMTLQEAINYRRQVQTDPKLSIPGKLVEAKGKDDPAQKEPAVPKPTEATKDGKAPDAVPKAGEKQEIPAAPKPKEDKKPAEATKDDKAPDAAPKVGEKQEIPVAPSPKEGEKPAGATKDGKGSDAAPKVGEKQEVPAAPKPKEDEKPTEAAKDGKAPAAAPKAGEKPSEPAKAPVVPAGPAAKGPAGTAISQVFPERLSPPDEKALKDLPAPKEGESFFITLHPAYPKSAAAAQTPRKRSPATPKAEVSLCPRYQMNGLPS